ncbi:hypothetical protein cypCar_00030444 [Cyprinus carpio]|nr:hypothetical protein cypCar_00030444 [Cyprinus carpio]
MHLLANLCRRSHRKWVTGYKMKTTVNSIWFINLPIADLKKRKQLRNYRVFIAVILAFFICWLPYHILEFYYISAEENQWSESAKKVLLKTEAVMNCLAFLNSCLNPILYVFMCDEYKKKLKQSLLPVLETAFAEVHQKANKRYCYLYACQLPG